MKFCCQCGHKVSYQIPDGDTRPRFVCDNCNAIHYLNPKIVVGAIPVWNDKILLCRRAIEPRKGYWTIPAGFMENGETTAEGASRESWEEAVAQLDNLELYRLFDLPNINQVYIFYRADLVNGEYGVGIESLETALFDEQDIPWKELAFPVVVDVLKEFFDDRKTATYPVRVSGINPDWDKEWKS
jgi:ADP-ribose pyrophosphatase YjhB (NUDIX family)